MERSVCSLNSGKNLYCRKFVIYFQLSAEMFVRRKSLWSSNFLCEGKFYLPRKFYKKFQINLFSAEKFELRFRFRVRKSLLLQKKIGEFLIFELGFGKSLCRKNFGVGWKVWGFEKFREGTLTNLSEKNFTQNKITNCIFHSRILTDHDSRNLKLSEELRQHFEILCD